MYMMMIIIVIITIIIVVVVCIIIIMYSCVVCLVILTGVLAKRCETYARPRRGEWAQTTSGEDN